MREIQKIFNDKKTENGDDAYKSSLNPLLDILFTTQYLRNNLKSAHIGTSEKEQLFARFIRDPRYGIGERDLGRELMKQSGVSPEEVLVSGRADDLIYMIDEDTIAYFIQLLREGNYFAKKWAPRLNSGAESRKLALAIIKAMGISQKEYRKLIKLDSTVEYKLAHKDYDIDFETIPSLAMTKYRNKFTTDEHIRSNYENYLERVKSGEAKVNNAVLTPYDLFKAYTEKGRDVKPEADIFFNKLEKVNLGSILPIVDGSGSMYDSFDSIGKALSIGHYVAKNNTYLNNSVITFSSYPKLIELGDNYVDDMKALTSFSDMTNTNFGKVMELLGELQEDAPEYLLVLSDMEFDCGSRYSKDQTMKLFKERGFNTKIIWWNFCTRGETFPETDEYGNIFMSGYSPQLLSLLESGFDGEAFLDKLLSEYQKTLDLQQ